MGISRAVITLIASLVLAAAFGALGTAQAQTTPQRIAVLDFHDSSTGSVTPEEIRYLSDLVRGSARSTLPASRFVLMTRENILEMLPEGRTLADCVGECAVETGRKIGADYIATGEVTMFAGEIRVTVNLHETGSGNLLGQVRAGAPNLLGVEKDLNRQILDLLAPLRGRAGGSSATAQDERAIGGGTKAWSAAGVAEEIVTFASEPVGAMVEIDGQPVAETPCKRAMAPGVYQVGFKKLRYVAHTQALEVKAGASPSVAVTLTPDFGWITVESNPVGLPVTIDGKVAGPTPITALEIDIGPHDVLVTAENYHEEGRRVVVERAEREMVKVAPVPRNGGLKVIATDESGNAAEARVKVDGVDVGRAYQPLTLLQGKHQVALAGAGGGWVGEVVVKESKLEELPVRLVGPPMSAAGPTTEHVGTPGESHMVKIPAGSYTMGSPVAEAGRDSDEQQHRVEITQGFSLSATEVTQAQYQAVMGANPSNFKGPDLPVEKVSWLDAVQFCNKLSEREGLKPAYRINGSNVTWDAAAPGYRLPTEAEWEYACRAGTATAYNVGDGEADLGRAAWYDWNSDSKTHPVGKKAANTWGLYDMHGNVWEWCWDSYWDYDAGSLRDHQGAAGGSYLVDRGGSWINGSWGCRSAVRGGDDPSYAAYDLGFRVARSSAR